MHALISASASLHHPGYHGNTLALQTPVMVHVKLSFLERLFDRRVISYHVLICDEFVNILIIEQKIKGKILRTFLPFLSLIASKQSNDIFM